MHALSLRSPQPADSSGARVEPPLEINGAGAQQVRPILEQADREVAADAQQPAHPPGDVAMIDVEPVAGSLPADRAPAALPFQHRRVIGGRQPVLCQQALAPGLAAAAGAHAFPELGVAREALALVRVDLGAVGVPVRLVPAADLFPEHRILRVALAPAFGILVAAAGARARIGGLKPLPKLRVFRVPLLAARVDLGGVGGAIAGRGGKSSLAKFRVQRIAVSLAPAIGSHRCREPVRREDARGGALPKGSAAPPQRPSGRIVGLCRYPT